MQEQLTLFTLEPKKDSLQEELDKTKEQLHNLRRGLFGRYDKLVNELTALQESVKKIQDCLKTEKDDKKIIKLNFKRNYESRKNS